MAISIIMAYKSFIACLVLIRCSTPATGGGKGCLSGISREILQVERLHSVPAIDTFIPTNVAPWCYPGTGKIKWYQLNNPVLHRNSWNVIVHHDINPITYEYVQGYQSVDYWMMVGSISLTCNPVPISTTTTAHQYHSTHRDHTRYAHPDQHQCVSY